ncbi:MAG: RNA polymerase sigma factor [Planctomycetota bacterium]
MANGESIETRRNAEMVDAGKTVTPEKLVRDHASVVLGFCMNFTKNFHDSEDIMQDVYLQAFTKLRTLRNPARVRPWLLKIARRMCIDHYRKRRSSYSLAEVDESARPDYGNEHIMRVHTAISKLPENYREAITLYYLDGRDCVGVASSLRISETAVRQRLVRARLMLHDLLLEDQS